MDNDLVETIVSEVLKKLADREESQPPVPQGKRALVLFSGGTIGLKEVLEQLRAIAASSYRLQVVLTPAAEAIIGPELLKSKLGDIEIITEANRKSPGELSKNADKVIIPLLTMNTAAKIAHGIADNLVNTLVLYALMRGKPVFAVCDACDPYDSARDKINMNLGNTAFKQMLKSNLDKLVEFGITLVKSGDLSAAVMGVGFEQCDKPTEDTAPPVPDVDVFTKRVLSAGDVSVCKRKAIKIGPNTVITAMAKDMARERGIEIIR
jgi:flavoprotein